MSTKKPKIVSNYQTRRMTRKTKHEVFVEDYAGDKTPEKSGGNGGISRRNSVYVDERPGGSKTIGNIKERVISTPKDTGKAAEVRSPELSPIEEALETPVKKQKTSITSAKANIGQPHEQLRRKLVPARPTTSFQDSYIRNITANLPKLVPIARAGTSKQNIDIIPNETVTPKKTLRANHSLLDSPEFFGFSDEEYPNMSTLDSLLVKQENITKSVPTTSTSEDAVPQVNQSNVGLKKSPDIKTDESILYEQENIKTVAPIPASSTSKVTVQQISTTQVNQRIIRNLSSIVTKTVTVTQKPNIITVARSTPLKEAHNNVERITIVPSKQPPIIIKKVKPTAEKQTQTEMIQKNVDLNFIFGMEPPGSTWHQGHVGVAYDPAVNTLTYALMGVDTSDMTDEETRFVFLQVRHQVSCYTLFTTPRHNDVFPVYYSMRPRVNQGNTAVARIIPISEY